MTVTLTLSLRDRPRGPLPLRVRRMTLMMTRSPSAEGVPEVCGRTWWRDSQTLRSGGWWRPCSPSPHIWAGMLYIPDLGDKEGGGWQGDWSPGFSSAELFVYYLLSALNISWWRKSSQVERGCWRPPWGWNFFFVFIEEFWVHTCIRI